MNTHIVILLLAAILVAAPQAGQQGDTSRIAAEKLTKDADQLRVAADAESQRKAIGKFEEALALWQTVGDRAQEAAILLKLSGIHRALGDNRRAFDSLERLLPLDRALQDDRGVVDALSLIGDVQQTFGEMTKAVDAYDEALALAHQSGYQQGEGRTLTRLGLLYSALGEYQKAADAQMRALAIAEAAKDQFGQAGILLNAGQAQQLSGDNQKALDYFRRALASFRELENRPGEAAALNRIRAGEAVALQNIGVVYGALGDGQTALDWYSQAVSLYKAGGNRQREALTLDNMGSVYLKLGENRRALELYNQALELAREAADRSLEARTLHNLADLSSRIGENQQATGFATQALSHFSSIGDRRGEAAVQVQLGAIYYQSDERAKALEAYNNALTLTRTIKEPGGEARALAGLARIDRDAGNLDAARLRQETALSLIESVRSSIAIQDLRASYFASTRGEYEFYISLLMQLHRLRPSHKFDELAFQAAERARARSLLELLIESRADVRRGVDPELLERDRVLQQRLNATAERYARISAKPGPQDEASVALKEIETQTRELEQGEGQIRAMSPHYAALTQPQSLSVEDVQRRVLDSKTLLLEYSLGTERSFVWAVTPTSLTVHELPARNIIESKARRVYELLTARQPRPDRLPLASARLAEVEAQYASEAGLLSRMLLDPVSSELENRRLLIISDGALQYLPFAALPVPHAGNADHAVPLIVEHEVVSMPSASTLGVLRQELAGRTPAAKGVAIFADPVFDKDDVRVRRDAGNRTSDNVRGAFSRLVFSRREAASIQAAIPPGQATQSTDFQASRTAAMSPALSQYAIIHFATHAILDNEHPELSGIVLSLVDPEGHPQDGFLRLQDLYNLNMPAELVVLSACQTALGKDIQGEGLVGLMRGFMYAGTPRIVASLWKVDDAATAELMKRFYQSMFGNPRLAPAAALRAAQIATLRQKQWAAPYYWAAFVLQGEWNGWQSGESVAR